MSNLVNEILLRLAKALAAAVRRGSSSTWSLAGPLGVPGSRGAGAAVLAERRGLHPARGDEPDLTLGTDPCRRVRVERRHRSGHARSRLAV